jgi:hypothetical protein
MLSNVTARPQRSQRPPESTAVRPGCAGTSASSPYQGRLDRGEDAMAAALRELREERA